MFVVYTDRPLVTRVGSTYIHARVVHTCSDGLIVCRSDRHRHLFTTDFCVYENVHITIQPELSNHAHAAQNAYWCWKVVDELLPEELGLKVREYLIGI